MSCECQECGEQYKVDFIVPDELWEQIKPEGKEVGAGLLCGRCIIQKIENLLDYSTFRLIEI